MATILFAAAGAAVGSGFGGTVLGLSGAAIGKAVGATLGRAIDQRILGSGSDPVEVGRIDRFHIMGASEGAPIAKFWGRMRVAGQVIWASPFQESRQSSGGKGAPSPKTVQYAYSVSLAIALGEGEILGIGRIWADGDEISPKSLNIRTYHGTEDQLPDPLLEAFVGDLAPAYRGTAYVVIESLDLGAFGNRVPQFSFEVMRRAQGQSADKVSDLQDAIRAVALIPGTGEYSLASQKVRFDRDLGLSRTLNVNSPSGDADLIASLNQLDQELPNCGAVSLVVSWFGNDLRCGACEIRPKVEQKIEDAAAMPWRSGGISRAAAQEVPRVDGASIYGGTPSDASVIESIVTLRNMGKSVMFYPFILMDQIEGNALPDPYSESMSQPKLPWRGRITLAKAPGRSGSSDQTEGAVGEVTAFFGTASPSQFSIANGEMVFAGADEWRHRRFILHNAYLCKLAGGVESFCIGSEMRGLTQIRGPNHVFPAVEALVSLAADVRSILGPDVKISYAADWSEYFGFSSGENLYFHLDPLWADSNIDFVGIDNYMPISDWRDGGDHADIGWRSIYNIDYLKANISGGEGFDWYYDSEEGVKHQRRLPIKDSAYDEDWVFRYKDLKSWWSSPHHNRISGVRQPFSSQWVPRSKPIRFTEYGCAAIDKGTNEPNKFLDLRSSESAVPRSSLGTNDDLIQMQYFRAMYEYWSDLENNPASEIYDGRMLDTAHCYAWAWDARPFPDFPRNTAVWSDGQSYERGHWLNGRATAVPVDRLCVEICDDAGLQSIDTRRLYGALPGYLMADSQSGRSVLQPLSSAFGFDCFEIQGLLSFQSRLAAKATYIQKDCLVVQKDGDAGYEVAKGAVSDAVARIRFSYLGGDGSFSASVAESIYPGEPRSSVIEAEFSMNLPDGFAKEIADRWLIEARLSQDQISLNIPISQMDLVAGSIVNFDGLSYRIDHIELTDIVSVKAVRVDAVEGGRRQVSGYQRTWKNHIEAPPVFRLWMDLPVISSRQIQHAPFLAMTSDPWSGPGLLWSSSEDARYSLNSRFEQPSIIGRTLSDLPSSGSGIIDRGPPLIVDFSKGEVESISLHAMFSGGNMVAIGDGSPENWEVFQFSNAEFISRGRYALSMRLRGLAGSNVFCSTWPSGSYVVLLNERVQQISHMDEQLNVPHHYRISRQNDVALMESGPHDVIAFRGIGLRPLSVCHLSYREDSAQDHHFSWLRRTRVGGDSWDSYEVPLSEDREVYSVTVKSLLGDVRRNFTVHIEKFVYTSEMRAQDEVLNGYRLSVSQLSTRYGAGPERDLVVGG
ncbi:baseplate multidomain protein megatron [Pseudotabrizicola algicola]|uniref:Host specificity protein n=1 Tax=Pseudotabrizicola algicola TaxID=2709381 RepID=A0A6B3RF94_9RHOB|nr:glycoside hydrolase/phage tail family protein [Pseudotabrizicola algicola]NEX44764.1 host specificity protein [Pseudotabrizicola algicola]